MVQPTIWIQVGLVIIYGSSIDAAPHSHQAIQVIFPKSKSLCEFNGHVLEGLTIVDSKVEHQLQMIEGWVLLIEPKSDFGQALSHQLAGQAFKTFCSVFFTAVEKPVLAGDVDKLLIPIFNDLNLTTQSLLNNKSTVKDKRIQQLLTELEQCLQGDCLKPTNWRAAEVAQQLSLSESRFLHLFSEQLGIAWRPYLLWQRMMCALQAIVNNTSATDAAHLAGFSDSAHLSRTFRNTFGMTIRQARATFKIG